MVAGRLSQIGRYQILGVLGKGSMGVVYKGMDPQIGKLVAIKTMNQKHLSNPNMRERFYREGSILGQLRHRNIIDVYNVGVDEDTCFIAMEYLEGVSLDQLLRPEPASLPLVKVLDIIRQVCEGVHAAHEQGIIHRDLKPANIFVINGEHVKVLDFGVAHFKNSQLTTSGVVIGTINYIAPEQITGIRIDQRADTFSIGVMLFELLAKKHPFIGKNISQTMVAIINRMPEPPKDIPASLAELLTRMLAKDRDQRPGTCAEVAQRLKEVIRTETLVGDTLQVDENAVDIELKKAQQNYLRGLLEDRTEAITRALNQERLDEAEELIQQLSDLADRQELVKELMNRLAECRLKQQERIRFNQKLTHETLLKANRHMNQKHYVRAIECCDKVLSSNPDNQDARIIRAACIKKMQRFLEQVRRGVDSRRL